MTGLTTTELYDALRCSPITRSYFGGVLAADELPENISRGRICFILNTDPSNMPGKHWIVLYMSPIPEYFDSTGMSPSFYQKDFENFLICNGPSYLWNARTLQRRGSNVCGHYCLYYINKRCQGYSMSEIVNNFSENQRINDHMVKKYYENEILPYQI